MEQQEAQDGAEVRTAISSKRLQPVLPYMVHLELYGFQAMEGFDHNGVARKLMALGKELGWTRMLCFTSDKKWEEADMQALDDKIRVSARRQ